MNGDLYFDGKKYISVERAAKISGYANDYIGQLCRSKKLKSRMVGRSWFVSEISLFEYFNKQKYEVHANFSSRDDNNKVIGGSDEFVYMEDKRPLFPDISEKVATPIIDAENDVGKTKKDISGSVDKLPFRKKNAGHNFRPMLRAGAMIVVLVLIAVALENFSFTEESYKNISSLPANFLKTIVSKSGSEESVDFKKRDENKVLSLIEKTPLYFEAGLRSSIDRVASAYHSFASGFDITDNNFNFAAVQEKASSFLNKAKLALGGHSGLKYFSAATESSLKEKSISSINNFSLKIYNGTNNLFSGVKNYFGGFFGGKNKFAENEIVPIKKPSSGRSSSSLSVIPAQAGTQAASNKFDNPKRQTSEDGLVSVDAADSFTLITVKPDITRREVLDLIKQYDENSKALIYAANAANGENSLTVSQSVSGLEKRISNLQYINSRQLDKPASIVSRSDADIKNISGASVADSTITSSSFSGTTGTFTGLLSGTTGTFSGLLTLNANLLMSASSYLNFGTTEGTTGYGVRDNGGTIQFKNSGGSWTTISPAYWSNNGSSIYYNDGNVGIGTSSPYAKLSVVGQTVSSYFTATTSTASTFPYASTTALTISGSAYIGSLNGPLQANNGLVSATTSVGSIYGGTGIDSSALTGIAQIVSGNWSASSTLSTAFGGTGWNSIQSNSILLGNGAGRFATTSAGTDGYVLALSNGVPTWLATSTLSTITGTLAVAKGGTGQTSFGQGWLNSNGTDLSASTSPTVNYITATSTTATSTFPYLSVTTNSNLGTVVGGTWQGTAIGDAYLTKSGDWTGTLDTYNGSDLLARANHTGTQGVATLSNYDWTFLNNYGAINLTGSSTKSIWAQGGINASSTSNFVYASTTALTVSGSAYLGSLNGPLQANNGLVSATTSVGSIYGGTGIDSSALTGIAQIVSGTWSASSTLSTAYGGTGWNNIQSNSILLGNGAGRIATTTAGTDGYVLALSNGVPTWLATSTLSTITGTLAVAKGGTGQTSFGQGWLNSNGTDLSASTSPTVNYITATSTTATSTFPYLSVTTNSNLGTVVGGTWQGTAIGDAYLTKSGDWTGTLDTYNGSDLLARANHTGTQGVATLSNYDWTFLNNYGAINLTGSSTKPIWAQGGLNASSTSNFVYASTTALTISGNSYLGTVSSGAWNGTVVGAQYGGTGINSSALTGIAQIVSGTWSASSTLSVAFGGTGWNSIAAGYIPFGNGAAALATSTSFYWDNGNSRLGIGTTTPNSKLTVFNNANDSAIEFSSASGDTYKWTMGMDYSDAGKFKIASSTALGSVDRFTIDGRGYIGIGTSTPARRLEVADSGTSNAQLRLTRETDVYTDFSVAQTTGDLSLNLYGTNANDISLYMPDGSTGANLWVCEGAACPSLTLSDGGNIVVERDIKYPTSGRMKRSIVLTAAGGIVPTSGGATKTQVDTATSSYYVLDFSNTATSSAFWQWTIPDSYDGGNITAIHYWFSGTAGAGEGVSWCSQYNGINTAENINADLSSALCDSTSGNVPTTANRLATTTQTLSSSLFTPGEVVTFKVSRGVDNSNDNFAQTARLYMVKLEYGVSAESD